GRLALTGAQEALNVDGTVSVAERDGSVSRLVAEGLIGSDGNGFRAENLRVRAAPIQLSLLSSVAEVPIGGAITGAATLTGTPTAGFAFDADLAHDSGETGRSRIVA